jgi:hypothetical protein
MCTGLKACEAVYRLQNIHRGIPLGIHHEEFWSPYLLAVKASGTYAGLTHGAFGIPHEEYWVHAHGGLSLS